MKSEDASRVSYGGGTIVECEGSDGAEFNAYIDAFAGFGNRGAVDCFVHQSGMPPTIWVVAS